MDDIPKANHIKIVQVIQESMRRLGCEPEKTREKVADLIMGALSESGQCTEHSKICVTNLDIH